ncbi:hypothetical protein [Methylomonas sp. EFPC1]|nr:hypothetical protein [Methylomonas sp. EFPC1]
MKRAFISTKVEFYVSKESSDFDSFVAVLSLNFALLAGIAG